MPDNNGNTLPHFVHAHLHSEEVVQAGIETAWRIRESQIARSGNATERHRLIRRGVIVPAIDMKPQLMHKDANGRWCPTLEIRDAYI